MAVADTMRMELVWRLGTTDWAVNVLHYLVDGAAAITQGEVDVIAAEILASWTMSDMDSLYVAGQELDRIRVRDLRTDGNPIIESNVGAVGTAAGNICPLQTCVVSTLRTAFVARSGRGRIYWPAPAVSASNTLGQLSSAAQTDFQAMMADLELFITGTTNLYQLGVYSRTDSVTREVLTWSTNTVFDVQTRRRDTAI